MNAETHENVPEEDDFQDAEPVQAQEHRRSVADDLMDDLYNAEQALKRERELRQRDKEDAAIREETLQKANADLTKALTSAERTIESLRDAADVVAMGITATAKLRA